MKNLTRQRVLLLASTFVVLMGSIARADIDWRSKGAVSGVQNQGSGCNNSWAFAVAALRESAAAIQGAGLHKISEQQLLDCVSGCTNPPTPGSCPDDCAPVTCALSYVASNDACSESSYPYTDTVGTCNEACTPALTPTFTAVKLRGEGALAGALSYAPVIARLEIGVNGVVLPSYLSYLGPGAFTAPATDSTVVQWVEVVGYTASFWIVRNSIGTGWGSGGYMSLARGANYLGIGNNVYELVPGPRTVGACTTGFESCIEVDSAACTAAGGSYGGDASFCAATCDVVTDPLLQYGADVPKEDLSKTPIVGNDWPKDWVVTIDDTKIDDGDLDDPENYLVKAGQAVLVTGDRDGTFLPSQLRRSYLRYPVVPARQGFGAQLADGSFPKAVKRLPRSWHLQNTWGTIDLLSKKTASILVPASIGASGSSAGTPTDATHYVCHAVKPAKSDTAQTPGGTFRKDLQAFFVDTYFRDCALLSDSSGPTFAGTAVEGNCLFDIGKPKLLCNPMNKSAVAPPRVTSAVIQGSTASAKDSLLCYGVKLASKLTSASAAALIGQSVGATLTPPQPAFAPNNLSNTPVATAPANLFPAPAVMETVDQGTICVPTAVLGVQLVP